MEPVTYELQVRTVGLHGQWYVDHRFPVLPERATVVALKDEALVMHEALYEETPEEVFVSCVYLGADERKAQAGEVATRGD